MLKEQREEKQINFFEIINVKNVKNQNILDLNCLMAHGELLCFINQHVEQKYLT